LGKARRRKLNGKPRTSSSTRPPQRLKLGLVIRRCTIDGALFTAGHADKDGRQPNFGGAWKMGPNLGTADMAGPAAGPRWWQMMRRILLLSAAEFACVEKLILQDGSYRSPPSSPAAQIFIFLFFRN